MKVPYINGLYDSIKHKLKRWNIITVPSITHNLTSIIERGKDKINKMEKNNSVYCIKCKNCDATYVGETKRSLKTRISEHEANIRRPSQTNSVITEHRVNADHDFDWNNIKILDTEENWSCRRMSEMLHIKMQKNPLNKVEDCQNLNSVYEDLLLSLKPKDYSPPPAH